MATHMPFTLKSSPAAFLHRTMTKLCSFIWVLLYNFVSSSFRHLIEHMAGSRIDDRLDPILGPDLGFSEKEEQSGTESSIFDGYDKSEFSFGFRFQMKEDGLIADKGIDFPEVESGETGDVLMNMSKYEFVSVRDFGGVVDVEPESGSFTVHELDDDHFIIKEKKISQSLGELEVKLHDEDFDISVTDSVTNSVTDSVTNSVTDSVTDDDSSCDEVQELHEKIESSLGELEVKPQEKVKDEQKELGEDIDVSVTKSVTDSVTDGSSCVEVQELHEKTESNLGEIGGLKREPVNWLGEFLMSNDSFSYGFNLSHESEFDSVDYHYHPESDDSGDGFISICPQAVESVTEPSFAEDIDDDYIELEPNVEKEPPNSDSNVNHESDSCFENWLESEDGPMKTWESDSDEEEEDADVLLEHQELIDQMKMELRNARTGGLPTILEECEIPRVKEDYKPLEINEKMEHRDLMAEIQKFYKSYTEKMRKLDVLNYQTLQAINFLRMKHPDQTNTGENTSLSAIKSVLLPSLWPCKLRRIYADPTLKSITELHKDLEIVYVGQACLSWEILHWQYKKAKELQLYDPQGYRSYNQTAIEFQQFHVLLRRFAEDELFQGPRVQNYTKQRCTLRGFLQVPAIKDDNLKEKKARKKEGEAVSISTMTKMIKESMMVFWEFLHTDKDTTNLFLTIILQGSRAHLQDPADSDLFMEIKTIHQKKERRLKDLLRTGNCIVRKFQKQEETILDQHMFVSQVELRLVSRVLSLPRLSRDQLVWCQSKLNNIKFIDRKILVEDSLFLLFPC